ncbi:hypothetical protein JKP88DRAFT_220755 [Tribonema minus]|uniref:Secreted protein n=1 Tax=Tribonema minus TaxID=303371 RepID=A0A836CDS2_9STRA|nr:hypothetical protein JKP88DRAFT_220755 [Tribonema minus]
MAVALAMTLRLCALLPPSRGLLDCIALCAPCACTVHVSALHVHNLRLHHKMVLRLRGGTACSRAVMPCTVILGPRQQWVGGCMGPSQTVKGTGEGQ